MIVKKKNYIDIQDAAQAVLREKFPAMYTYIRNEERSQIRNQ